METVKFVDYSGDTVMMHTTPTGNAVVMVGTEGGSAASILMPLTELISMVKELEKKYYGN